MNYEPTYVLKPQVDLKPFCNALSPWRQFIQSNQIIQWRIQISYMGGVQLKIWVVNFGEGRRNTVHVVTDRLVDNNIFTEQKEQDNRCSHLTVQRLPLTLTVQRLPWTLIEEEIDKRKWKIKLQQLLSETVHITAGRRPRRLLIRQIQVELCPPNQTTPTEI